MQEKKITGMQNKTIENSNGLVNGIPKAKKINKKIADFAKITLNFNSIIEV